MLGSGIIATTVPAIAIEAVGTFTPTLTGFTGGNTLLTFDQIVREALRVLHQNMSFTALATYDSAFAPRDTLRVRIPTRSQTA